MNTDLTVDPDDPDFDAKAQAWADTVTCRYCGHTGCTFSKRLVPLPIGTYSIGGAQPKMVATERMFLHCGGCQHESMGK